MLCYLENHGKILFESFSGEKSNSLKKLLHANKNSELEFERLCLKLKNMEFCIYFLIYEFQFS